MRDKVNGDPSRDDVVICICMDTNNILENMIAVSKNNLCPIPSDNIEERVEGL